MEMKISKKNLHLGLIACALLAVICTFLLILGKDAQKTLDGAYIGMSEKQVRELNSAYNEPVVIIPEAESESYINIKARTILIYRDFDYLQLRGDMAYWFDSQGLLVLSAFHPLNMEFRMDNSEIYYKFLKKRYGSTMLSNGICYVWTIAPKEYKRAKFYAYFKQTFNGAYFVLSDASMPESYGIIPDAVFTVLKNVPTE